MSNYKKRDQKTYLEIALVGIFKAVWWLVRLPFGAKAKKYKISQEDKNLILKKRLEIESLMSSENYIDLTHALIESDKMVDHIFKIYNYPGETFADRLRYAENKMDKNQYNMIWQSHKTRNRIVHETDHNISPQELRSATIKLVNYIKNV